jgi:hypothetical protein
MDYEAIKTRIERLIEEARQTPGGRVETALEPLREALLRARREGVKIRPLYDELKAAGVNLSPSSFAKYAQRHLQMKKIRSNHRPVPTAQSPVSQPVKQKSVKEIQTTDRTQQTEAKPRVARGDY